MKSNALDSWFLDNRRSFPWRESPTPYRVWVSEVMLQQTRASVVVDYFQRWMDSFPTVESLAAAPLEQVIKLWEGLGYYSRARNLHAGAQQIMREFNGKIPGSKEELLKIRGLGPYTVAAIMSFGFKQRAAAVDGNVLRVIARMAWIDEDICRSSAKQKVTAFVEDFLNEASPWVTAEALIELGATVCTPAPRCEGCPLQPQCVAFSRGQVTALPIKSSSYKVEKIVRDVAVVESEGSLLVRKNPVGKIMGDLCEFPYFEGKKSPLSVKKELAALGITAHFVKSLTPVQHSFTRYLAQLFPFYFQSPNQLAIEGFQWIPLTALKQYPFSSGHRKILGEFI